MKPRRKNSTKATKDSVITIRVTQADKERYEAEAKSYGMKTSKYILYSVDHKAIPVVEGYEARDGVSIEELRSALATCVDRLNHFCGNL